MTIATTSAHSEHKSARVWSARLWLATLGVISFSLPIGLPLFDDRWAQPNGRASKTSRSEPPPPPPLGNHRRFFSPKRCVPQFSEKQIRSIGSDRQSVQALPGAIANQLHTHWPVGCLPKRCPCQRVVQQCGRPTSNWVGRPFACRPRECTSEIDEEPK